MSGADGPRVVARAPAKLNLSLAVGGLRPDGYHELCTLMVALERADRVALRPRAGREPLRVRGPGASPDVPTDRRNLAWRALEAVLEAGGADPEDWSLELHKELPSQAGLGGGSSDAAAAALAARQVLGWGSERDGQVAALLAALGSDCAFFYLAHDGLAWCEGRGERVESLSAPRSERAFCVVTPDVHCASAAVYRALDTARVGTRAEDDAGTAARGRLDPRTPLCAPLCEARAALFNDLEPAALAAHPALAAARAWLDAQGAAHFRLAGSGASFFGLFEDEVEAGRELARLRRLAATGGQGAPRLRASFACRASKRGATLDSSN